MEIIESYYPLKLRLLIGLSFFLLMGIWDYQKNPTNPKRVKEYLFIISFSMFAMFYGVMNDSITFYISREYFEVAKGLGRNISFFPDIVYLAIKATYWVGILVGTIFIVANNPTKKMRQLGYRSLFFKIYYPLFFAFGFALIAGIFAPYAGPFFTKGSEKFLSHPMALERVAFIHWGQYLGGALGVLVAIYKIRKDRTLLKFQ